MSQAIPPSAASGACCPTWLIRLLPFLRWRHRVTRQNLRDDLIAAITGAIVVLPQGVAFAVIAGMPPEYGLYAGMVPAIIAALWGSSWHLVSGPTTAASVVLFSSISVYAAPASPEYVKLVLTLTFMVGVIQLILGAVRLGTLVNFISHSVVIGFTAGAALLIMSKQLGNFFGVSLPRGGHLHDTLIAFFQHLPQLNGYVTAVALVTLLSGIAVKRFWPRMPYMIVAMTVGSLLGVAFNFMYGETTTGIATVGALPASLPPLSAPELSLEMIKNLAPAALAVTLFALTEAVSIGRAIALKSGQNIDGNQEFIGQGLSNLAGSFFSGYVATGSFNRSGLNYQAGAKTPLAAVMAGVMLMAVVLLVAPYAAYLPKAAMAGILFLVAWGLIDFKHIKHIIHSSRSEASILATTFFGALFLELEFAIFLGVMLSLVLYLNRTSRPSILTRVPDISNFKRKFVTDSRLPECPQLKLIRIDGSLFFGAVPHVEEVFGTIALNSPEQKHMLVIATGVNFIDLAGAEMLAREAQRRRALGGGLYLYDIKPRAMAVLEKSGTKEIIGEENIFQSKNMALGLVFEKLDKFTCVQCEKRIFLECRAVPRPGDNG